MNLYILMCKLNLKDGGLSYDNRGIKKGNAKRSR